MPSVSKAQIAAITGTLLLIVLLFLANTRPPRKEELAVVQSSESALNIESAIAEAKASLQPGQRATIKELETQFDHATTIQKAALSDSLTKKWDAFQKPVAAAYYCEQKAVIYSTSDNWTTAGNRYFNTTRLIQPDKRNALFQLAIRCFGKAVEINPGNTTAKINLAACYVEGTTDPMKGISLLKEIEKTDSNNINLQLNFAAFSEKSGQFDKAIQRYNKVLKIDPGYIEAYLHLADAYENKGDKPGAIESLEKYLSLVDDVTIKTEVKNYINKLSREDSSGEKQQ